MPIIFMQSFLGQFSSTGFISVFRISPLFKGIGYVSLALNLLTLTYYSLFGAIPLLYLLYSIRPSIPWSCESSKDWMKINENYTSICAKNYTIYDFDSVLIPSVEFFKTHMNTLKLNDRESPEGSFSWTLLFCNLIIWGMVAAILIKPIELIGKFIRYSCLTVIGLITICFLRFAFLPGALLGLEEFFHIEKLSYAVYWPIMTCMAYSNLGPGWGSILTMASYNDFKTNIFKNTWVLGLAQTCLMLGLSFLSIFVRDFMLQDDPNRFFYRSSDAQWMDFLMIPTGLTFIEVPHFWSLLFFGFLILGSLNLLIVQLLSVLTSLFDEHEVLRGYRREVCLGLIGVLAISSIYFCSNHGITFFEALMTFSIMTQMVLNLLLLIVVLWIYGRERFQRDLHFMTNQVLSTWMINIVKYVAPLFLIFGWLCGLVVFSFISFHSRTWLMLMAILVISLLPWCFIPGYCIFKIMQTTGILGVRLRRGIKPNDWYPVDPVDRQKYEETFNNSDMSHQLAIEPDVL
ncbi:sodium-dependent proline transporter-like isoform X2 [Episyrphus balteatus]|uniref:sodium-dependent proline transporter-like isoform X2 n=1 Tax=Episyrphus balteatus TaxID=286459 RepID=UPI002486A66F|nr:sodium-dependent proline transporter-like isoform X2 [Episyrphus balteatus]